jgi:predicted ATPase with chaperone activity
MSDPNDPRFKRPAGLGNRPGIRWAEDDAPAEPAPTGPDGGSFADEAEEDDISSTTRARLQVKVGGSGPASVSVGGASTTTVRAMVREPAAPEPAPPKRAERSELPKFEPREPRTFEETGLDGSFVQSLILRYLLTTPTASSRDIAQALCLASPMVKELTDGLGKAKLIQARGSTAMGDFIWELSQAGRDKAIESRRVTSYVGPAPVPWEQYLESVKLQALSLHKPKSPDLERAFKDLDVSEELFERVGPAVTSARPMFLFGEPGNGKTSLAERMTQCFGDAIWIPQVLLIDGHLVKLYDPAIHKTIEQDKQTTSGDRVDRRWLKVRRPTVIAGGELTLDMLEIMPDPLTSVAEPPLQLKANCGTLVIDDFGRGKTPPKEILNRWIFPLEKRVDFLKLPDGRKFSAPFECLLVFSTNLEPRDLADEAFLRRIPYKIRVHDPTEDEFKVLLEKLAASMGVALSKGSVTYLVERHYKMPNRPMRFCHPRDLLLQVLHLCDYDDRPPAAGPPEWDRVVANYFGAV